MNNYKIEDYTIEIRKLTDEDGGGYIARIVEFDCIGDGESVEEAIKDVYEVGELIIETAKIEGKTIPRPNAFKSETEFSGKFTLRLPKNLHKKLTEEADQENCSLNSLLLSYISYGFGNDNRHNNLLNEQIDNEKKIKSTITLSENAWARNDDDDDLHPNVLALKVYNKNLKNVRS